MQSDPKTLHQLTGTANYFWYAGASLVSVENRQLLPYSRVTRMTGQSKPTELNGYFQKGFY
jgi:alkylated DNA nucleotide flippase Atl1